MVKLKSKHFTTEEEKILLRRLYQAIGGLRGEKEAGALLVGLLTDTELIMLARRIYIAGLLLQGDSYIDIKEKTHAGTGTIAHVQRWLDQDKTKCTKQVIKNFEKKLRTQESRKYAPDDQFSFVALKKKYPLHFLLFNIFDKYVKK